LQKRADRSAGNPANARILKSTSTDRMEKRAPGIRLASQRAAQAAAGDACTRDPYNKERMNERATAPSKSPTSGEAANDEKTSLSLNRYSAPMRPRHPIVKALFTAIVVLSSIAAQPVVAAPWDGFGGLRFDVQDGRHRRGGGGGGFQRPPPQRELQRPERMPEPRRERMTDEERRDLRRDIDRANREIYKGRREP
jgi:hypothetical protein